MKTITDINFKNLVIFMQNLTNEIPSSEYKKRHIRCMELVITIAESEIELSSKIKEIILKWIETLCWQSFEFEVLKSDYEERKKEIINLEDSIKTTINKVFICIYDHMNTFVLTDAFKNTHFVSREISFDEWKAKVIAYNQDQKEYVFRSIEPFDGLHYMETGDVEEQMNLFHYFKGIQMHWNRAFN